MPHSHRISAVPSYSTPTQDVTQEHYIRASSLSVAGDFTTLIADLRRRGTAVPRYARGSNTQSA